MKSYSTAFHASRVCRGHMMAQDDNSHRTRHRSAFTLVEMLVVIGIIVLLIGIAAPMLNRAWKNAVRTRMAADLQAIATGLDAYRQDFKDYPRIDYSVIGPGGANNIQPATNSGSAVNIPGAVVLCWALLAPGPDGQDGADGPGFRLRSFQPTTGGASTGQGDIHGPYIAPGRFKIGGVNSKTNLPDDSFSTINDRYGHPYLYFPANRAQSPQTAYMQQWSPTANPPPAPIPMFNATDNLPVFMHTGDANAMYPLWRVQAMVGDIGVNGAPGTNPDGIINGAETANFVGNYILWGAGPDEVYGPNFAQGGSMPPFDITNCDDVIVSQ